jgi:hypothetical protein
MIKRTFSMFVLFALFSGVNAEGAVILFKATMDGPSENPPIPSPGTGEAVVAYDSVAHTLGVSMQFADLVGTTTVAHIHCCVDPPGTVGVATFPGTFPGFPAGVTSGSYANSWDLTLDASYTAAFLTNFGGGTAAGAEAALLAGMLAGRAYVNIHTSFAGGGEIRGFLREAPEPGALLLFGLGAAVVGARRRRRSPGV